MIIWYVQDRINLNDLKKYNVPGDLSGLPVCPMFCFSRNENQWQELFFKACYQNGVSLYNVPYVNYSHKEEDIQETLTRMEKAIQEIK